MEQLDHLLSRLQLVKKSGKVYTAKCPAHGDQQASLSTSTGDDGLDPSELIKGLKAARAKFDLLIKRSGSLSTVFATTGKALKDYTVQVATAIASFAGFRQQAVQTDASLGRLAQSLKSTTAEASLLGTAVGALGVSFPAKSCNRSAISPRPWPTHSVYV